MRADELFDFTTRPSWSPLIEGVWETTSGDEGTFTSTAATNWEIVITRREGETWLVVRGAEAEAGTAPVPRDAEFLGITFTLGTFMPDLSMPHLVGRGLVLPQLSATSFWLDGEPWELPQAHNADVFVERLVRAGLLVHDPVVVAALANDGAGNGSDPAGGPAAHRAGDGLGDLGDLGGLSVRSVERRVARATGLRRGTIRQIRRANHALELLEAGVSPLEVARRAGYADQPHLTRSLKRFLGQTPSQIVAAQPAR
jgi:AraC-like DNA-binding protein